MKVLFLSTPLSLLLLLGYRLWRVRSVTPPQRTRNVLIVGVGELGRQIAASISADQLGHRRVVGFIDDDRVIAQEVLGRFADLRRIARSQFIDEIILAIPDRPAAARWLAHVARLDRLKVTLAPDLMGFDSSGFCPETRRDFRLITLHQEPIVSLDLGIKRTLDLVLSSITLVLLAPAMATIALLVRLDSPGPALYRASRVGKKGTLFECFKFRTMVHDADTLKPNLLSLNERKGPLFKLSGDPRITRIGGFLRRYSLDELPQLWNVITGEMSLVGPRPHPVDDFNKYGSDDRRRLVVTPGITGLWQVTARRDPSFEINMALDVEYIENWTLWLDLKIICKTFSAIWEGSGA